MAEELLALESNRTWDLVSLPCTSSIIGSKWVYSIKIKSDGTLDRYKAHLIAQGYKHEYRIDYEETFAPVAKMASPYTAEDCGCPSLASLANGCE